jgi:hypothetical protein
MHEWFERLFLPNWDCYIKLILFFGSFFIRIYFIYTTGYLDFTRWQNFDPSPLSSMIAMWVCPERISWKVFITCDFEKDHNKPINCLMTCVFVWTTHVLMAEPTIISIPKLRFHVYENLFSSHLLNLEIKLFLNHK